MLQYEERIVEELRPGCSRIELTGPSRRGIYEKRTDILCVSRTFKGIFEDPEYQFDGIRETVDALVRRRVLDWREPPPPGDARRYLLELIREEVPLTVHVIRPPAQWGVVMLVKTGPRDYVDRMITLAAERGYRYWNAGYFKSEGSTVLMPGERDVFRACGTPFVSPQQRR